MEEAGTDERIHSDISDLVPLRNENGAEKTNADPLRSWILSTI